MHELVVVNRFRVDEAQVGQFRVDVHAALEALAACPGYVDGGIGFYVDEPELWLLSTTWANVGSYRRALSTFEVKMTAVPLLSRAVDEPSAYEGDEPGAEMNEQVPRELR